MSEKDESIGPGAYVQLGVILEENVKIGANAVVLAADGELCTLIKKGASIGANSTVMPGVTIGEHAIVSPGSVVTRSVPPMAIVQGNPSIIIGYKSTISSDRKRVDPNKAIVAGVQNLRVKGVTYHEFRKVSDLRGDLTVAEFQKEIPFLPKRYFLVFDVPSAETRGEHAHIQCHQFLIAVKGSVSVVVDDGEMREEITLDKPNAGLYLPPMTWGIQYKYSSDAVLLVFASHYYDAGDYIREYGEYIAMKKQHID